MQGVKDKDLRVDFICLHHYWGAYDQPEAGAKDLRKMLEAVHALYDRPIWLTEFALSNWKTAATPEQQQAYMAIVLPMLDELPYLERYAWFALPPNPNGDDGTLAGSNLSDDHGVLNALGQAYRPAVEVAD
jgi:hypothetical protein